MRIAQIHSTDHGGGAEILALDVHRELRRRGHECVLWVGRKTRDEPGVSEIPRLRGFPGLQRLCRRLEGRFGLEALYRPGFRAIARRLSREADVVIVRGLTGADTYADIGALPRLTRSVPTILWMDDMWLSTGHCAYSLDCIRWQTGCGRCPDLTLFPAVSHDGTWLNWRRKRHLLRRCEAHLAVPSEYFSARIASSPTLGRLPCRVVYNGVDTAVFHPGGRAAARDALGLPHGGLVVMIGANHLRNPFKPASHAIQSVNAADDLEFTVLLVGNGADELAGSIRKPVRCFPHVDERPRLAMCYQASDILLLPSLEESFGLMAAEAMASGCCVLAYCSGALPEVIGTDGDCGVLVARGDPMALALALRDLVRDPDRRVRMGQASARRVAELFAFGDHVDRLLELVSEIVLPGSEGAGR